MEEVTTGLCPTGDPERGIEPFGSYYNLYKGNTSKDPGYYTPESIRHPAKMSLPLCRRILDEMLAWGWLSPGAVVVDPFGGRGSTAIEWCRIDPRNRAITCELEPHYIEMERACKELSEQTLGRSVYWHIIQGDSRKLHEQVPVAAAELAGLSSPPYGGTVKSDYTREERENRRREKGVQCSGQGSFRGNESYGDHPEQIGRMKDDTEQALAALSSPPYGQGVIGFANEKQAERLRALTQDPSSSLYGRDPDGAWFQAMIDGYHNSEGNIDNYASDADLVAVSSPPYASMEIRHGDGSFGDAYKNGKRARENFVSEDGSGRDIRHYGKTDGQIGSMKDDTEQALTALSSPPYEDSLSGDDPKKRGGLFRDPRRANDPSLTANYNGSHRKVERVLEQIESHVGPMCSENGILGHSNEEIASLSSPPYNTAFAQSHNGSRGGKRGTEPSQNGAFVKYGNTPGQIEGLPDACLSCGGFGETHGCDDCGRVCSSAVSSAPYEAQSGGHPIAESGPLSDPKLHDRHAASKINPATGYAENRSGQIGTTRGETYASACLDVYRSLNRSGVRYVSLVTKNPVKKQRLMRLDLLTVKLMEQAGYRLVAHRKAWLWETRGQARERGVPVKSLETYGEKIRKAFAGREDDLPQGRISFFHQIHLANGKRPPAQWEDVLMFSKVRDLE